MVSFETSAKGLSIFLSNCLHHLLIINEGSTFKVAVKNVHIVYAWNLYPLDGKNDVNYFSKKGERRLFPHKLSSEQLLILQLNNDNKRKHHRILINLHFEMNTFDVVG